MIRPNGFSSVIHVSQGPWFFLFLQIWSTLPGFSLNTTDLVAFKNIAWSLGMIIKERPEIRLCICSGGQSTQIKYLSKSTDTYNKILLHKSKSTAFSILLE